MDGVIFEVISTIPASGISEAQIRYQYSDDAPGSGDNFYRLKQVDRDGSYKFSEIIVVTVNNKEFEIFPNPATDYINIHHNLQNEVYVEIVTATGRDIYTLFQENNTHKSFEVDISDLPQGIYIIKIISGNTILTDQFVKIH